MRHEKSPSNQNSHQQHVPQIDTSVPQQLAFRPTTARSISAPGHTVPSNDFLHVNSPVTPTDMATLLNAYSPSHPLVGDRSAMFSNPGSMSYISTTAWQGQSNLITMPAMEDTSTYLQQSQALQEAASWMNTLRPSPSIQDLDFASEVSAAPSPFVRPSDSYYGSAPHIKSEDADSPSVFASRIQTFVPLNATQAVPLPYTSFGNNTPMIKEERHSPVMNDLSAHESVSSHSGTSPDSEQDESEDNSPAEPRRRKRVYATGETGQHQCHICKQFFQRSYNLKSHMRTHDPMRERAWACHYPACDKSFERRADLNRHIDSVHIRDKKHPCFHCGAKFTRKDTARRHMEDGCPRRWDQRQRQKSQNWRRARHRSSSDTGVQVRNEMPTNWQ